MSAITAALRQIDDVAAEGDLAPDPLPCRRARPRGAGDPIVLPDGKRDLPAARCTASRVDELALRAARHGRPGALELPAPDRPARRGQEPDRARDRLPAVDRARPRGRGPPRRAVLRLRGDAAAARPRTSSSSATSGCPSPAPADRSRWWTRRSCRRMREGWVVMIDEVNTIRDVCLLSINATLRRPPRAATCRRPARPSIAAPGLRASCWPTTRAWSARPTSPTPGTRASRPRSRSRATGPRSRARRAAARWCARRPRWTASGSPARTGWRGRRSSATSSRCGG